MSSTNNHNKFNNKKEDVLESTPKVRNDHCSGTSDGLVSSQKRSCDAEAEACLKEKYKELTDALVRLQTNSESSSPNELTRTLLVTGMSEKEAWKLQDEENYSNINGLGYAKRARAHLLRDLAKWEN